VATIGIRDHFEDRIPTMIPWQLGDLWRHGNDRTLH
jgi:hypothetical protein